MRLKPDCIPCILKMTLSAVRKLTRAETVIQEITVKALQVPALQGLAWDRSCPEVIELVMNRIMEVFQSPDPFRVLKEEQNDQALKLYPHLKGLVQESFDPLRAAVHLAILGNSIDLMVSDRSIDPETVLAQKLKQPIDEKAYGAFREKLEKTRRLVYLGDNAGEILFDKVLIETIREQVGPKIFFVVRTVPTLNDVTGREAREVGMDALAVVIENGIQGPLPGTILSRCSPEVRTLFQEADLILSKGGGNFGTLGEAEDLPGDITFLLMSKCLPYCRHFQVQMFAPVLANRFLSDPDKQGQA